MWLNKTFTNSVTSFNVYNEQRNDRENNMGEGIAVYIKEHTTWSSRTYIESPS